MKSALKITSWIAVVLGVLAIFGGLTGTDYYGNPVIDGYAIFGGLLFLTQGILSLVYIILKED